MSKFSADLMALLLVATLPALLMGIYTGSVLVAVVSFMVALAHAWVLGLPAVVLLRKIDRLRWWSTASAGLLVGAIPSAICAWPYSGKGSGYSAWDGKKMVDYVVDGRPTLDGWHMYAHSVAYMALWGCLCALCYWCSWRYFFRERSSER